MKIRSLHDRVIIRKLNKERKTQSGIILPALDNEKSFQGEVVSTGSSKVKNRSIGVNVGDKILFSSSAGQKVKANGEELTVLKEEDVLGKINSDNYDFKVNELELLRNFILVKPFHENKIGNFIIPFEDDKAHLGRVIKLGEGSKSTHDPSATAYEFVAWEDINLSVDNIISYGNFYNKKADTVINGEAYIVMTDFDIECILEDFNNAA